MSLLVQYAALQLLDLFTTLLFLSVGVEEGNPLIAQAMVLAKNPLAALVGVKTIALIIGVYCWSAGRNRLLRRANVLFTALVVWNAVAFCVAARHIS